MEFSQAIYPQIFNIQESIIPGSSQGIVSLFSSSISDTFESYYRSAGNHVNVVFYLRDLRAKAIVKSLNAAVPPDIDPLTSPYAKALIMHDYEWKSPRFHLELIVKSGGKDWISMGEISLLNRQDVPYMNISLSDIFADGTFELAESSAIGIRVKDVGFGFLSGEDRIDIFGTVVKEVRVISLNPNMEIIGKIEAIPYAIADPGYAICDGRALNRNIYFQLFQKIGTTFGSGDNTTTFNIPNLQNRTIVGAVPRSLGNAASSQSFNLGSGGSTLNSIALYFQIYTGVFI